MPVEVDFLPMAISESALVDSQANYAGSGYQQNGFQPGITLPTQYNKGFRQGTVMAAVIANFIANMLNENVLDNGDIDTLISQFTQALQSLMAPEVIDVAASANPVFNAAAGNPLIAIFSLTLAENVAGSTIENVTPGQILVFNITNPAADYAFVAPAGVPMSPVAAPAGANPSAVSTQVFLCLSAGQYIPLTALLVTQNAA